MGRALWEESLILSKIHSSIRAEEWNFCPLGLLEFIRTIFQTLITKHYYWFALVNKYFRGKIMQTSLTLTEVWPISDRIIRQKYYCITVHYRIVCTSENRLGQTVQTGQQALGHLELFSD